DVEGLQAWLAPERRQPIGLGLGAGKARVVLVAILRIGGDALLRLQGPARCAGRTLLGEDLDDAVRGLGAIERGRGGALQHLDALDGGRIDIVEARRTAAPLIQTAHTATVIDPDPVDVDDRLLTLSQAGATADAQLRSLSGNAAGGECRYPRLA